MVRRELSSDSTLLVMENKPQVIVVGATGVGSTFAQVEALIQQEGMNVHVIDFEQPKSFPVFEETVFPITRLRELPDLYSGGKSSYVRKLDPHINIAKEYHLIQDKKSSLSRWERDEVVRIYEGR